MPNRRGCAIPCPSYDEQIGGGGELSQRIDEDGSLAKGKQPRDVGYRRLLSGRAYFNDGEPRVADYDHGSKRFAIAKSPGYVYAGDVLWRLREAVLPAHLRRQRELQLLGLFCGEVPWVVDDGFHGAQYTAKLGGSVSAVPWPLWD